MYTGKPIDFHHFIGEMSESIEYPQDEISNDGNPYRTNFLSFRACAKGLPSYSSVGELLEAASIEEELLAHQPKQQERYKCFRCFGTNRDIKFLNGQASVCPECDGTQYIPATNNLANILEQVLHRKLPHLPPRQQHQAPIDSRRSLIGQLNYGSQRSIQEQECSFSYVDETMKECESCHSENQAYHMFSCTTCPDYYICFSCYERKKYTHPLAHELVNKGLNRISVRYISDPKTMKKISEEVESEEASNYMESSEIEIKCHSCNQAIQDCYMACTNCESQNSQYTLCAECAKEGAYLHDMDHKLDLRTLSQGSKLTKLNAKPSASESELTQPTPSKPNKFKSKVKVKDSLVVFDGLDLDDCDNEEEGDLGKYQQINLPEDFIRLRDWQREREEQASNNLHQNDQNKKPPEDLFMRMIVDENSQQAAPPQHHTQEEDGEGQDFTHLLVKKKGRKIEESMVNIDMETSIQIPPSQKSQQFTPTVAPFAFSTVSNQIVTQKSIQSNPQEYCFNDYQCDICKVSPIKNKRYHCKECQNFDLCQMCYIVRSKRHQHKDYELIDGVELIKKSRESMMKLDQGRNKMMNSRLSHSRLRESRGKLGELSNRV